MNKSLLARFSARLGFSAALLFACVAQIAQASEKAREIKPPLVIPSHFSGICKAMAETLPNTHLLQLPLDDGISRNAWTNLLTMFDYDRSLFTQEDIREFENWETRIDDDLKRGDLAFPCLVYERAKKRSFERLEAVEMLLKNGFEFTADENYTWKRKNLPWPKDAAEQSELLRLCVKNELLARNVEKNYKIATSTNKVESAASTNSVPELSAEENIIKRYSRITDVINDADPEWLLQQYLTAIALAYDPHSSFMMPDAAEDFEIDMSLSLCGIGATLSTEDGAAKVMELVPGGPAARDKRDIHLRVGDKIIAVAQDKKPFEDIMHLSLSKSVRRIRGPEGTRVVLRVIDVQDPTGSTIKEVDLIREQIKLEDQAATGTVHRISWPAKSGETNTTQRAFGVIKLPSFYASNTTDQRSKEFRSCTFDVQKIMSQFDAEVEGLILDLRGNGGGSLREAITLTGSFIRFGPVVQVREAGNNRQVLNDENPAIAWRKPLVVLVNRVSASASEIVAAALQDYGRAIIIGDSKTHGKGSVQTVMPLASRRKDFGTLKVTCAQFYRINGGTTQLHGVVPDIILPSTLDWLDIGEDKLPGALPWNQIAAASYRHAYPIAKFIPTLTTNMFARINNLPEYEDHLRRVEHVKEVNSRDSLTLNYEKRYAMFAADSEFGMPDDASESDAEDAADDEEEDAENDEKDFVLHAALEVLAELTDLQGGVGLVPSSDAAPSDWMLRFFRGM